MNLETILIIWVSGAMFIQGVAWQDDDTRSRRECGFWFFLFIGLLLLWPFALGCEVAKRIKP